MSREIKFRAWDGRQMVHDGDHWNGENRQNNVPSLAHPVSVTNKGIHWCKKLGPVKAGDIVRDEAGNEGYTNWEVDRVSSDVKIMQYTGLKDARGQEICEGDILERRESVDDQVVKFERKTVQWNADYGCTNIAQQRTELWLVVGNIYENPELLGSEVTA